MKGEGHADGCGCARCTGFIGGNEFALKHGAYAVLRLQPRAKQLRDDLAALVPFGGESDAPILDLAGIVLAQVERAGIVLAVEQAEQATSGAQQVDRLERLSKDCRAWIGTAGRLLDQLGLSPTSRARLAGDLATVSRTVTAQDLRQRYGGAVPIVDAAALAESEDEAA